MKFTIESTVVLTTTKPNGQLVKISKGDMVNLKLDLPNMDLTCKNKYMSKYPDGWVRGQIYSVSPKGERILFFVSPHTYFNLYQKDILDIKEV